MLAQALTNPVQSFCMWLTNYLALMAFLTQRSAFTKSCDQHTNTLDCGYICALEVAICWSNVIILNYFFFCSVNFLKEGLENICIWQISNTSISQTHKPCLQLSGGHSLTAMMTYYRDKAAINHHISILKTALTKTIVITYGLCFYILCHNLCICLALSAFVSHFFLFFLITSPSVL